MNTEFKGTQGEWVISSGIKYTGEYSLVTKEGSATFGEDEHNAQLIAAAPELLKALQTLLSRVKNEIHAPFAIIEAEQAINKALDNNK